MRVHVGAGAHGGVGAVADRRGQLAHFLPTRVAGDEEPRRPRRAGLVGVEIAVLGQIGEVLVPFVVGDLPDGDEQSVYSMLFHFAPLFVAESLQF